MCFIRNNSGSLNEVWSSIIFKNNFQDIRPEPEKSAKINIYLISSSSFPLEPFLIFFFATVQSYSIFTRVQASVTRATERGLNFVKFVQTSVDRRAIVSENPCNVCSFAYEYSSVATGSVTGRTDFKRNFNFVCPPSPLQPNGPKQFTCDRNKVLPYVDGGGGRSGRDWREIERSSRVTRPGACAGIWDPTRRFEDGPVRRQSQFDRSHRSCFAWFRNFLYGIPIYNASRRHACLHGIK